MSNVIEELIDRRAQVYGDPTEIFPRVAEVWSGILGVHVNAVDVALCMIGYKTVRAAVTPDYSDNTDDIDGYNDIVKTLVGQDMIKARSVTDYIAQKWPQPPVPGAYQVDTSAGPMWTVGDEQG